MAGLIIIAGVVWVVYKLFREACETPYEPNSVNCDKNSDGSKAWEKDNAKVVMGQMSWKEFDKNKRAGKYK